MKASLTLLALLAISTCAVAEEEKPLPTQAAEGIAPYAKAIGDGINRGVMEFMAGTGGSIGNAAKANLAHQDNALRQANRGTRKTMKECIKPGNVIDDDVKECTEGLREKSW
jgi:hypothetical protein